MRRTVWAERKLQDKCLSRESDAKRRRHYLGGCRPAFRVRGTRGISQAVNPPVLGHTCVLALAVVLTAVPGAAQVPSTEKPSTQRPPTEATPPRPRGAPFRHMAWASSPRRAVAAAFGLDLLYAPPTQGRLAVTPSLTVSEEFRHRRAVRRLRAPHRAVDGTPPEGLLPRDEDRQSDGVRG